MRIEAMIVALMPESIVMPSWGERRDRDEPLEAAPRAVLKPKVAARLRGRGVNTQGEFAPAHQDLTRSRRNLTRSRPPTSRITESLVWRVEYRINVQS